MKENYIENALNAFYRMQHLKELDRLLELYHVQYAREKRPQAKEAIKAKITETEEKIEKFCLSEDQ
jgi:hypothetical protein